jgi:hypothetical protein
MLCRESFHPILAIFIQNGVKNQTQAQYEASCLNRQACNTILPTGL